MPAPSIKGTAFDSVLQDVRLLLNQGRLSRKEVEARLRPEDRYLLDEKIAPASWYPIDCYARLLEQLCEIEGEGQPEVYLFRRGAIAAERLHAAAIYPQLDASQEKLGERLGVGVFRLVLTLAGSIYNFTAWSLELDETEDFRVHVDDARSYPDVARFAAEGFLHWTAERLMGRIVKVWSERPTPDRVTFHVVAPKLNR